MTSTASPRASRARGTRARRSRRVAASTPAEARRRPRGRAPRPRSRSSCLPSARHFAGSRSTTRRGTIHGRAIARSMRNVLFHREPRVERLRFQSRFHPELFLPVLSPHSAAAACFSNPAVASSHREHVRAENPDLIARVSLAHGHRAVLQRPVIHRHRERDPELVVSRVPLPHRRRGRVQLRGDALGGQLPGELLRVRVHPGVVHEREDRELDGRDERGELKHRLLLVVPADVERVLEHAVHDAADPERRLDDGRREIPPAELLRLHAHADHPGEDLFLARGGGERRRAVRVDFRRERERRVRHRLGVLLERLAHVLLVRLAHENLGDDRLVVAFVRGELNLALVAVRFQVKRAPVREADALDPSVRALDLRVPAVLRVVRHLVLQVLAEPQTLQVDADLLEEHVRARDKVRQGFVRDDPLRDRLSRGHQERLLHRRELRVAREQVELHVRDFVEPRVLFLLRMHEVLDLRLLAEVHEDPLRGLRSQEPLRRAAGADLRREHQVERVRRRKVVLRLRGFDPEVHDRGAHLFRGELLDPREHVLELSSSVRGRHGVRENAFQVFLDEVVGAEAVLRDDVFHHEVRELLDVPGGLKHDLRGHGRALELEHSFVQDEVLPPERLQVRLHRATGRAVVVQARDAAVDLERRDVKQPLFERAGHLVPEVFLLRELLVARGHRGLDLDVERDLQLFQLRDRGVDLGLVRLVRFQRADVVPGRGARILHRLQANGVVLRRRHRANGKADACGWRRRGASDDARRGENCGEDERKHARAPHALGLGRSARLVADRGIPFSATDFVRFFNGREIVTRHGETLRIIAPCTRTIVTKCPLLSCTKSWRTEKFPRVVWFGTFESCCIPPRARRRTERLERRVATSGILNGRSERLSFRSRPRWRRRRYARRVRPRGR
eukprot:31342-Pelagococcus_subviridis.AAC.47